MAQIFRPNANTLSRASLFCLIAFPAALVMAGSAITRSSYNTKVEVPFEQPVPFSHQHHAAELGIDCRYCHTTVEKSSFAGMPATETCMTCHSQIWTNSPLLEPVRQSYQTNTPIEWTRLNHLPDFVYFNHSIHINRGINCNVCHGPVQKMQLAYKGKAFFMYWCLDCHRKPEKALYQDPTRKDLTPREQVFNFYTKYQEGTATSPREVALLAGKDYKPSVQELQEGKALVDKLHIKTKQLADCWICHR
jgi:hypothetical protein